MKMEKEEIMPYKNEHSARLIDPDKFDPETFFSSEGGKLFNRIDVPATIRIIWGKLKEKNKENDPILAQALRFPIKFWTEKEARKWLEDNQIKYILFEPAEMGKENKSLNKEERHFLTNAEYRITDNSIEKEKILEGYAAVFDVAANIGGLYREYVRSTAFNKTIKEADIRALFNHDSNYVLGRNKAGTLELITDNKGLFFRIYLPKTEWANGLMEQIRRGDITQCSCGFRAINERWYKE